MRAAYEIAQSPHDWNDEQNRIVKEAEAIGEDEEDMLEDEDEPPTKKRKAQGGESQSRKAKGSASATRKPASKGSSVPRKSVGTEEAEGEEGEREWAMCSRRNHGAHPALCAVDPETKKVRGWRHSLQRSFLSKDGTINPDDMDHMNKTLKLVEEYGGITADVLRTTKIGKVMRRIVQLPQIPRDDEFSFKERAEKLCDKWAVSGRRREGVFECDADWLALAGCLFRRKGSCGGVSSTTPSYRGQRV